VLTPAPAIDPNGEPLPPEPPPTYGRPAMNTEYFLGSEARESQQFEEFAQMIQRIQLKQAADHHQPIQRGFHAKSHACLHGRLELERSRDPRTRYGVFAGDGPPKDVIVRFSNGVGWKQSDSELDARGMAVKVLDVAGPKYLPDEQSTQDFLMTNSPTPVGRDAVEFMEFARANANGQFDGFLFLIGHAPTAAKALALTAPVDSMVTERYWSGGAYHLGAHQAIKFSASPCDRQLVREPSRSSEDYLREDLVLAAKDGVCMRLFVQFQTDPMKTPIEDASVVWQETESPPVPVAKVVMPPQDVTAFSQQDCDQLSYSPWHAIPAHKPMGNINRVRRYVYNASRFRRGGGGEASVSVTRAQSSK
jgi:catalase